MDSVGATSYPLVGAHDAMTRTFERIYPYLLPAFVAGGMAHYSVSLPCGNDILNASITMGAIFIGFLATAKSIMLGLQTRSFEIIRGTDFFRLLVTYLKEAIYIALAYCVLCLVIFFIKDRPPYIAALWGYFTVATILGFFRIVHVFMVLVAQPR